MKRELGALGLTTYVEFSGYRGYHLWLFFNEWIPIRYVNMLEDYIVQHIQPRLLTGEDVQIEFFPNKSKVRTNKMGQRMMLPYGIHTKTVMTSHFIGKDGNPIEDVNDYLKEIIKYSLNTFKKILGALNAKEQQPVIEKMDGWQEYVPDFSDFPNLDSKVEEVLNHCSLMGYLCRKAKDTGYLNHFERLSILYVFGHLGNEGKEFVHTVMEFTINYQYHVTEKFIQRLPDKPVSCIKLREHYKVITAEYGCNCNFRRTTNCYPSPVLHAIKNADDDISDITVPMSRSLSKAGEKKAIEEMNVHQRVQDMSKRIVELKKQKRGLDKNIQKLESCLSEIFDQMNVDCMEIEMGLLVRRKTEDGYEWVIEL